MPVVLLVRHGQASAHGEDYDVLSDLGREQARVVGAELQRRSLRDPVVVSGGLRRQRHTADEAVPELARTVDDRWDEFDLLRVFGRRGDPGDDTGAGRGFQGMIDDALAQWIDEAEHDGWVAFRRRTHAALDDLIASLRPGQDAVAFTSGGVIATLAATLIGGSDASVVALNRVAVNAGITKITVGSSGPTLVGYNDHAHFEGDRRSLLPYR
jgi:broad specificity phosphatase PhoE